MSEKSITKRAAKAIKGNAASTELKSIKAEIAQRIQAVAVALKGKAVEVEEAMRDGDLDALHAVRQSEADLRDEDKMLHRQQSELHRAIEIAQGEEAVKAADQHAKNLEKALKQAETAQAMLQDSRRAASDVILARRYAAGIGQTLKFQGGTIRALATAIYAPDSNQCKQAMIDLGIREAKRAYL